MVSSVSVFPSHAGIRLQKSVIGHTMNVEFCIQWVLAPTLLTVVGSENLQPAAIKVSWFSKGTKNYTHMEPFYLFVALLALFIE